MKKDFEDRADRANLRLRAKKSGPRNKGEFVTTGAAAPIELSAIGLGAEFSLFVDDRLGMPVFRPIGMRGWSEVIFERIPEGTRHRFPIYFLNATHQSLGKGV